MQRKGEDAYLSEQSCACTVANSSVGLDVYAISLQGRAKKARSRRGIHSSRHAHLFILAILLSVASDWINMNVLFKE
jgi:hypothetical protein